MKLLQASKLITVTTPINESSEYKTLEENMKKVSLTLDDFRKKYNE
jgi:hypothetical protein